MAYSETNASLFLLLLFGSLCLVLSDFGDICSRSNMPTENGQWLLDDHWAEILYDYKHTFYVVKYSFCVWIVCKKSHSVVCTVYLESIFDFVIIRHMWQMTQTQQTYICLCTHTNTHQRWQLLPTSLCWNLRYECRNYPSKPIAFLIEYRALSRSAIECHHFWIVRQTR